VEVEHRHSRLPFVVAGDLAGCLDSRDSLAGYLHQAPILACRRLRSFRNGMLAPAVLLQLAAHSVQGAKMTYGAGPWVEGAAVRAFYRGVPFWWCVYLKVVVIVDSQAQ
jgi:hypothetical protein